MAFFFYLLQELTYNLRMNKDMFERMNKEKK